MPAWMPSTYIFVALVAKWALAQQLPSTNSTPPSIIKQARKTVYFLALERLELACIAKGIPDPVYTWQKNGNDLDLNASGNKGRMMLMSGVGSLVIIKTNYEDAGIYQCIAENSFGKSFSIKTNLMRARMEPFRTVLQPKKLKPHLGHSLILECSPPESIPEAKTSWIIEGSENLEEEEDLGGGPSFNFVELDQRITMDWDGNLYITRVKPEDSRSGAKYVCMANNVKMRSYNQGEDKIIDPIGVRMASMPVEKMWQSPDTVLGLLGKSVRFKCIFSGNPQPTITWKRLSGQMDTNRMNQSRDYHEFEIKDLQYSDAGEYQCAGTNPIIRTPKTHTFTLTVESKPYWLSKPVDIEVGVDEGAKFPCQAEGIPKPKIEWFINGNPLASEPPYKRRVLREGWLLFTNLTKSDSQVIQCNVSNKHGYLWADVFLHVLAIPAKVDKKPMDMQKVAEDQTITITCESSGKPKPTVIWFKGDQQLSGDRYDIQDNGNLVIKNVKDNDSGNYKCFARNKFGKDSADGILVVRKKTKISQEPIDVEDVHGNEAVFQCAAITDPDEQHNLKYIWLKDGKPVDLSNPRISKIDGELTIKDMRSSDTGKYTCRATNDLDSAEDSAQLKVKAPPDPPYNIDMTSCYATEATIIWAFNKSQENFSPLQNFIIEYNTSFSPNEWIIGNRPGKDERKGTITLSPYARYNFRVKAVNGIGVGKPSQKTPTICKTPEARPSRHPHKVKSVLDKTNFLVIEWEPMSKIEHNAPKFKYNITVQEVGSEIRMNYVENDYRVRRKEIAVNTIYKPYKIIVRAQNTVGQPRKDAKVYIGYSGEAAPKVVPSNFELDPEKNISATSAGFQWDPVDTSVEAIQGKFQGYKIRFWKKGQDESTRHEVFIPHASDSATRRSRNKRQTKKIKAEVKDLPSFSEIEADVVAVNSHFSSNGSNVVNFSTPEGVPSAVRYLVALYRGSSHFLLEWGEPEEMNGKVVGYGIGFSKIAGLDIQKMDKANKIDITMPRRMFLGGLEPDSMYRVYVWANTSQGQGELYFIDVKTTEKSADLAKPKITDTVASPSSVNVTWELPNIKGQRVGAFYYLEYRKLGMGKWENVKGNKTVDFWQEIYKLQSGTSYEVRVIAKSGTAGAKDYKFMPSEKVRFETTGVASKGANVLSAGWFIGMMVAIALLLLILIIVCIIKRNRGDKYHVQEKERLRGSNPDDAPDHFNDDENGVGQSGSFDNHPEKVPLEMDETDSMEEYGDVDPSKFNEDGSFIGQYGVQKSGGSEPAAPSAMSTFKVC